MSGLFLAVDGGQSGTVAVLGTADGTIVGVGRGGPIRHHEEADAERLVRESLFAAVTEAMSGATDGGEVVMSCLAVTGSGSIADRVIRELVSTGRYLLLESDICAALASGTGGAGGIGLIAGTGTVALAQGRRGDRVILGGWGWLLGDEGGGFWIAMEALKAAVRDVDATGPSTVLSSELPQILGQFDMREVYNLVTGQRLDRTAVASLATSVVALAEAGDGVAASILDRAADHLSELVVATVAAAAFLDPDERVVVACGGVLRADGWVVTRLAAHLEQRVPEFTIVVPAVPPVIGAYYLALKELGVPIDAALQERVADQVRLLATLTSKVTLASSFQPLL